MGQTHGVNFFVDFLFCLLDTSSFFDDEALKAESSGNKNKREVGRRKGYRVPTLDS